MQQFVVPQFIDVEDKIIGPITTRQFIIMLAASLLIAVFYKIFDFTLFATSGLIVLLIAGVIAFLKVNGRPFHFFILNLFQTFKRPKLRIWLHNLSEAEAELSLDESHPFTAAKPQAKNYSSSRLAELSLIVDTKGAYKGESEGSGSEIKSAKSEN